MSVEAHDLMNHEWTRWQGHHVNGVFPLGRCLGASEHSGVFATMSRAPSEREVAIKLLPASRAQEELQLPRWAQAAALAHPHLLPLLEWGACRLEGLPYLYVVMEYADQTLAQLLRQRALTEAEAREMLPPILDALAVLHRQGFIQGELKPANILVVHDQLKMASDTIRHVRDNPLSVSAPSAYDPPEGRDGGRSTAADIWTLGVTLSEALTRRSPSTVAVPRNTASLPADFSPALREIVSRCLSYKPQDRPAATELLGWLEGRPLMSVPDAIGPAAKHEPPAPRTPAPAPPRTVPPEPALEAARPTRFRAKVLAPRALVIAALGAALVIALIWSGLRFFGAHAPDASPAAASAELPSEPTAATNPSAPADAHPVPKVAMQSFALHEVIPEVPRSASRTIRGHVKVTVRAIVDANGSVSAVVADRGGPSKYFQRLALAAAKKWTFSPLHPASRRLAEIEFDFSRDGTAAHAAPVEL